MQERLSHSTPVEKKAWHSPERGWAIQKVSSYDNATEQRQSTEAIERSWYPSNPADNVGDQLLIVFRGGLVSQQLC